MGALRAIVLTLVNASPHMDCWEASTLACSGLPRDDGRVSSFRARALR